MVEKMSSMFFNKLHILIDWESSLLNIFLSISYELYLHKALFHLYGEVITRRRITYLSYQDIVGDIERAYALLAYEWVIYMKYLQNEYPYLFYTALIHNPCDDREREEIEKSVTKHKIEKLK